MSWKMELNNEVVEILKEYKINKDEGVLCLLGIFHGLDVDTLIPDNIIKAINITKIVEKDYSTGTIKWNIPLYSGQQTAFDWVEDWMKPFGQLNPERKGVKKDCVARMKRFFGSNPEYRKEDVYKARDMYLSTVKDPQYLKSSHKFIYEGAGDFRSSILLQWCEKVKETSFSGSELKGVVR